MGALSPMLIGYSLVAKEDTLVNFLSLLALLFLSVSLEADGQRIARDTGTGENEPFSWTMIKKKIHPKNLDGYAITAAFLSGLALASKYTFVFYAFSWIVVIFFIDRTWVRRRGPPFLFIVGVTFILLSWYYLNPYWLALGIGHWLWESATGHSTYFLGSTYTYPPVWFYPVTFMGRVAPLISIGGFLSSFCFIISLFRQKSGQKTDNPHRESKPTRGKRCGDGNSKRRRSDAIRERISSNPLKYLILSWIVVCFIIMTILPFKGIRYVQWIILPLTLLTALGIHEIGRTVPLRGRGITSLIITILVMIPALSAADPYYREVTYFLDSESGMKDLDGQGFRETFRWMEDNGHEGRVSARWEKLASYYWDNVTGPVVDIESAYEEDVSFILIYRADTNRDIESGFTEFARTQEELFVYEHENYDLVWLYRIHLGE
jgi:4-amino-4-deoxy-L-arabinose transferase-like glycosyltransferase